MLQKEWCRARQKRLIKALESKNLEGAVITSRLHVYYFTGYLSHWNHTPAAYISRAGKVALVGWISDGGAFAADDIVKYPAHRFNTMPPDQARHAAGALAGVLPKGKKLGVDLEGPGAFVRLAGADAVDITSEILDLRQSKDPDELECLRKSIHLTELMYAHVKEVIKPGLNEMELFTQLRSVVTHAAGKDLEEFGNDFRSGEGGGAPRNRPMKDGELYVLDSGPSLNGYHADNCRTFAVNRKPTDAQMKAWKAIVGCLAHVEPLVKPGIPAVSLYRAADDYFKSAGYAGMIHHLGHGIGLQPHEAPQFNPEYNATVRVGDVFTFEPGLYGPELNAGIRLEQDYALTEKGLERLTKFPLDLA
jgi:Xaa-Pro dipeptidase